jgi:salicylate hydroxylase
MKALIAGGGIGGLTAALCLLDAGIEVELFERSSALTEIGAGIQISPNGVKVLQRLGLKSALDLIAFRPEALEMRHGPSGARVFAIPMRDEAVRRYGAPYYHIHRADLMTVLGDALTARAPNAIRLGRESKSFAQTANGVELTFVDGTRTTGDILIGADGIHSSVRTQLFGEAPARFTGNVAWRVVVLANKLAKDLVPPTACVWVGPGRHAVTYYLRRGELINFVGVVERDGWQKESWTELGHKADLIADYAGWATPITALIAQATECYRWALFDRDPLPRWSDGRATLLGDACHPMLPFLAQGAVMAIEDAWVLSRKLKSAANVPDALAAYEAERKPRTARAQKGARAQMGLYHKRTLISQLATYAPIWLAANLTPQLVHARQDWLYQHDVVAQNP